jgi:hypothetical protein
MTLHDLENAVTGLTPEELERFRAWFASFDADAWDRQFEEDVKNGKLDALADKALRAHQAGMTTEL